MENRLWAKGGSAREGESKKMDWEAIETDQVRGAGAQIKMRAG